VRYGGNVMNKKYIVILAIFLFGTLVANENILPNFSFEEGLVGWKTPFEKFFSIIELEEKATNDNKKCLKVTGDPNNNWMYFYNEVTGVNIISNQTYDFGFSIKCENLKGQLCIGIRELDEESKSIKFNLIVIKDDCDWKKELKCFKTNEKTNKIQFYIIGRSLGENSIVYLDDL
jgi:hypothetical protein